MTRDITCPVCGRQECGQHDSVLAFARFMARYVPLGVALLTGLIVAAVALTTA